MTSVTAMSDLKMSECELPAEAIGTSHKAGRSGDVEGQDTFARGDLRGRFAGGHAGAGSGRRSGLGANARNRQRCAGLADIVVTANRRSERLQDVPISVTAVTKDVERQNVRDISDLTKLVPGLTINYGSQPGNFSINMRGIGTLSNGIAVESDVAVVIDDVPVGFQAAAFKDLIDVERIEALKGPQSTLFGKSAIAGVLNVTTQAPTSTWTGRATGLVTNDREWRLGGTISGPITDTLKMRLTVARDPYAGNVRNITNGTWLNGSKGLTVTGKLQWDPSEKITVSLQPRFNQTDATCCVSPINSLSPGLFYQGIKQLPESSVLAGIPINDPANTKVCNDFRSGGIPPMARRCGPATPWATANCCRAPA
jgi:iron complex outermembrane receptor protein